MVGCSAWYRSMLSESTDLNEVCVARVDTRVGEAGTSESMLRPQLRSRFVEPELRSIASFERRE